MGVSDAGEVKSDDAVACYPVPCSRFRCHWLVSMLALEIIIFIVIHDTYGTLGMRDPKQRGLVAHSRSRRENSNIDAET